MYEPPHEVNPWSPRERRIFDRVGTIIVFVGLSIIAYCLLWGGMWAVERIATLLFM